MVAAGLTLGSLFDGIAGFPLAAAGVGIKTVWTSEIEPNCIEIAARHFPEAKQLGDITKLNGADLDPVDIISFGSPCQNLSTAGNQKGLDGEKSQLFFEAVRVIDEMRCATDGKYPKYIIWENVAGAFSSNKGQDFRRVLEEVTKTNIPMPDSGRWAAAGMVRSREGSTAWRVLDAQYWGVPQRRKRIFLVCSFGNDRAVQILFECESVLGYSAQGAGETKGDTAGLEDCAAREDSGGMAQDADGQMTFDFGRTGDRIHMNAEKSVTLKATDGGGGASTGLYMLPVYVLNGAAIGRTGKNGGNQLGIMQEDTAPTLTTADRHAVCVPDTKLYRSGERSTFKENTVSGTITAGQEKVRGGTSLVVQGCGAYRLDGYGGYKEGVGMLRATGGNNGGGSETLVTEKRKGKGILKHIVRRLTPLECERLDGFPDGWTQERKDGRGISDNARYTALGNSIAVPCAARVFRGIIAAEAEVMESENRAD